jgi:hypothetical protein
MRRIGFWWERKGNDIDEDATKGSQNLDKDKTKDPAESCSAEQETEHTQIWVVSCYLYSRPTYLQA